MSEYHRFDESNLANATPSVPSSVAPPGYSSVPPSTTHSTTSNTNADTTPHTYPGTVYNSSAGNAQQQTYNPYRRTNIPPPSQVPPPSMVPPPSIIPGPYSQMSYIPAPAGPKPPMLLVTCEKCNTILTYNVPDATAVRCFKCQHQSVIPDATRKLAKGQRPPTSRVNVPPRKPKAVVKGQLSVIDCRGCGSNLEYIPSQKAQYVRCVVCDEVTQISRQWYVMPCNQCTVNLRYVLPGPSKVLCPVCEGITPVPSAEERVEELNAPRQQPQAQMQPALNNQSQMQPALNNQAQMQPALNNQSQIPSFSAVPAGITSADQLPPPSYSAPEPISHPTATATTVPMGPAVAAPVLPAIDPKTLMPVQPSYAADAAKERARKELERERDRLEQEAQRRVADVHAVEEREPTAEYHRVEE